MWYNLNFIQWTEAQTFKRSALPETWKLLKGKGTMVKEQELRKDNNISKWYFKIKSNNKKEEAFFFFAVDWDHYRKPQVDKLQRLTDHGA